MQLINATKARKNFFSILDEVYFDGKEYVIEKGSRVKVKVSSVKTPKKFDFAKYRENIKKSEKFSLMRMSEIFEKQEKAWIEI